MSFQGDIKKFNTGYEKRLETAFRKIVFDVGFFIIKASPVDTGRFRGNWQFTNDRPASGVVGIRDPTPELVATSGRFHLGDVVWVSNNLPYAQVLEDGHSQQAPDPPGIVKNVVPRFQPIVRKVIREVFR